MGGQALPLNAVRRRVAENMQKSWTTVPHVLQVSEADFYRIEQARREAGTVWKEREGFSLTYLPFILRALSIALGRYPKLNATFNGDTLTLQRRINVGIAVDMSNPDCCVPRQFPENRPLAAGDVVFCELSAALQDYSGQVLRTFTVGADATPLYRDLYATAEGAFDAIAAVLRAGTTTQQIIDVSAVIEDAGFTTCDDLVHGYGGGYLPPILGSRSRPVPCAADMVFAQIAIDQLMQAP